MIRIGIPLVILLLGTIIASAHAQWQSKTGPLMTRWARDVSPTNAHPEYPRPQMVRTDWLNLNGLWDYAIRPKDDDRPREFDGQILVPFPVESALSGVMQPIDEKQRLWYRRTFDIPAAWAGRQVLLHFGAVDWEATLWINSQEVGTHRGGYDPFTFDITAALHKTGPQEIVVAVWDPTDTGPQPRGKQVLKPEGIWYTPTSGIWQTVWLEPVPETYIDRLRITPDPDRPSVSVSVAASSEPAPGRTLEVIAYDNGSEITRSSGPGTDFELVIPNAKLWTPNTPHLYDLKVTLRKDGQPIDEVTSYAGLRKISLGKDENGVTRIMLNNQPFFMYGPLDQGFWPDGLYTAPTDEALRYDIEMTRQLGCNMARKHVKVEPDRWYYWCDKLGLLVWQDMPSGDRYIGGRDPDITRSEESARQFDLELTRIIDAFRNHPCIVMWVPFNEGWGQFDTPRVVELVRKLDPTRLVNNASGWTDRGIGDVHDIHSYPGPAVPRLEDKRAAVLGEFGGLGLPLPGHTWQAEKNWGYRSYTTQDELTDAYIALIKKLHPLTGASGLAAAVYTQTTDVEVEVNGLMTYDRAVLKMDKDRITAANKSVYPALGVGAAAASGAER